MLKKMLKYDIRSIWRFWWIIAVSTLGLSVVGACLFRFFFESEGNEVMEIIAGFSMLLLIGCFFGIVASIVITEILIFIRYYKHFFTDEGYLTFTLPVRRSTLLLSKTINAVLWMLLHFALFVVCILIFFVISPPTENGALFDLSLIKGFFDGVAMLFEMAGAMMIVYIIEALVILVLLTAFSVTLVHFCITLGAIIARKAKVIAAIGIYYGVNSLMSFITQVFGMLLVAAMVEGLPVILSNAEAWQVHVVMTLVLAFACVIIATPVCIFYFMTLNRLERRLNLT